MTKANVYPQLEEILSLLDQLGVTKSDKAPEIRVQQPATEPQSRSIGEIDLTFPVTEFLGAIPWSGQPIAAPAGTGAARAVAMVASASAPAAVVASPEQIATLIHSHSVTEFLGSVDWTGESGRGLPLASAAVATSASAASTASSAPRPGAPAAEVDQAEGFFEKFEWEN